MSTRTAQVRREEERRAYNANLRECPGHEVLATLSDKWVTLVLAALGDGPLRRAELSRVVAGATPKMLTQTLRKLERDGLVDRSVVADVPPQVTYSLTQLGVVLLPVQRAIKDWAETHIAEITSARRSYDSRSVKVGADGGRNSDIIST